MAFFLRKNLIADMQTVVVLFVILYMDVGGYNRFGEKCYLHRHGHLDLGDECSVFF
jgi:hypothetical protein